MGDPSRSLYLAESYYWRDLDGFQFREALTVTTVVVSSWCNHYAARLIASRSTQITPLTQSGELPEDAAEREALIHELIEWISDSSEIEDLFALFLSDQHLPHSGRVALFDHHDDTDSWALNLTTSEFVELQVAWAKHDLPDDLFYPADEGVCIPYPGDGIFARFSRVIGAVKCFTPKQWELYEKRNQ